MSPLGRIILTIAAAFAAMASVPLSAQDFPELTGRVVDAADILSDDDEASLTARLETIETETERQLVVATIPDLQGYDISDYGYQLGRAWGIGDAERNDGVLLIVAPNERKVRIEVGYGLEGILTDAASSLIIQNSIIPSFKAGDMSAGIRAGVESISMQLGLTEEEVRAQEAARAEEQRQGKLTKIIVVFTLLLLPFLLIVVPMIIFARAFPEKYAKWKKSQAKGVRVRTSGSGSTYRSSHSSFSSSSFSGGGGSFGGGGASGSW